MSVENSAHRRMLYSCPSTTHLAVSTERVRVKQGLFLKIDFTFHYGPLWQSYGYVIHVALIATCMYRQLLASTGHHCRLNTGDSQTVMLANRFRGLVLGVVAIVAGYSSCASMV